MAVFLRHLNHDAERSSTRYDRHLANRIGIRREMRDQRVAGLMVRNDAALLKIHQTATGSAEQNLIKRVFKVCRGNLLLVVSRGDQRRLIDQIRKIGASEAGGRAGHDAQVEPLGDWQPARVDGENRLAPLLVWEADRHLTVKPARTEQRGIEHVRTVRRRHDDDFHIRIKTIHLDEELIERLLALIIRSAETGEPLTANSIKLVNEDDGW